MRPTLLKVLCLLIAIGYVFPAVMAETAIEWNDQGIALANQGKYQEALAAFDHAIELAPDQAFAWSNKAAVFNDLGRYQEGLAAAEKALSLDPTWADAWNNRGVSYYSMKQLFEALESYTRALELAPYHRHAWANRAAVLNDLQRYQEGLEAAEKALVINPNLDTAWQNKGVALIGLMRYQEALTAEEQALTFNPNNVGAWNNKGLALMSLGRYSDAIAALDTAIALNPDLAIAWKNKGDTYSLWGKPGEALEAYQTAQELDQTVVIPSNLTRTTEAGELLGGNAQTSTGEQLPDLSLFFLVGIVLVGSLLVISTFRPKQRAATIDPAPLSSGEKRVIGHEVFISYSTEDKPVADAICNALESNTVKCWVAPRDIIPGMGFQEAIIDAIDSSLVMVLVFSSHSNASPHVISEVTEAMSKEVIIVPFRIEDILPSKAMKYLIGVPHWLDAITPPLEKHIDELILTIKVIVHQKKKDQKELQKD